MIRKIEYVGWIRAPAEGFRANLHEFGIAGPMNWEQQTRTFGVFSHCLSDQASLEHLYAEVEAGRIDVEIGGFTGVWKRTRRQVPRSKQHFYSDYFFTRRSRGNFIERWGYKWSTTPGVGYERIDLPKWDTMMPRVDDEQIEHPKSRFSGRCEDTIIGIGGCLAPVVEGATKCPYCGIIYGSGNQVAEKPFEPDYGVGLAMISGLTRKEFGRALAAWKAQRKPEASTSYVTL